MDSIEIKVPGLAGMVLKRRGPSSYKPPVVEEPKKATRKRASSVKPKPAAAKKLRLRRRQRPPQSPLLSYRGQEAGCQKSRYQGQVCFC